MDQSLQLAPALFDLNTPGDGVTPSYGLPKNQILTSEDASSLRRARMSLEACSGSLMASSDRSAGPAPTRESWVTRKLSVTPLSAPSPAVLLFHIFCYACVYLAGEGGICISWADSSLP